MGIHAYVSEFLPWVREQAYSTQGLSSFQLSTVYITRKVARLRGNSKSILTALGPEANIHMVNGGDSGLRQPNLLYRALEPWWRTYGTGASGGTQSPLCGHAQTESPPHTHLGWPGSLGLIISIKLKT
uniref:Uncharacterized protein n=1 Tax=Sphaerodactylus townsendi TaxID=933632 RepID=A0ACB8G0B4_9SAUR